MKVSKYAKALVAGLAAGGASLATGLADGNLSTQDGLTALAAVLAAWGLTWAVPNKPQGPQGL